MQIIWNRLFTKSLTTKMILETDKILKLVQFEKNKFNIIDR